MALKIKITLLVILFLILGVGLFLLWNLKTGTFKFGADTIFGCQSTRAISSIVGPPGSNLTSYNLFGHVVTVNKIITPALDSVQAEVNALKTGYTFDDIQTYNSRSKRGGGGLSLHSYGIAIDINPLRNPRQSNSRQAVQTDIPKSIIDVFANNGFQWGGEWAGNADPMHFEWYGDNIVGSIIDGGSGQTIVSGANATIDGKGVPISNGDFSLALGSVVPHKVVAIAPGYGSTQFDLGLICFQDRRVDIALTALPENTYGSISGKITFTNNKPILIAARLYLDGRVVGQSGINGNYYITNVGSGAHKLEAKILTLSGSSVMTPKMAVGQNIQNLNIVIGQ